MIQVRNLIKEFEGRLVLNDITTSFKKGDDHYQPDGVDPQFIHLLRKLLEKFSCSVGRSHHSSHELDIFADTL
jgi:RecA-family ATPase